MMNMVYEFTIRTFEDQEMVDITSYVYRAIEHSGVESGLCNVFIPHTTAGLTINENEDPDVVDDILEEMDILVPQNDIYKHVEGNSDAHVKSSLMGVSLPVIIHDGALLMGRWQGIFLVEFDGPRTRTVYVKIMADTENPVMLDVTDDVPSAEDEADN